MTLARCTNENPQPCPLSGTHEKLLDQVRSCHAGIQRPAPPRPCFHISISSILQLSNFTSIQFNSPIDPFHKVTSYTTLNCGHKQPVTSAAVPLCPKQLFKQHSKNTLIQSETRRQHVNRQHEFHGQGKQVPVRCYGRCRTIRPSSTLAPPSGTLPPQPSPGRIERSASYGPCIPQFNILLALSPGS